MTRAEWRVAREIVVGLTDDLLARDRNYWELIGHRVLEPFDQAVRAAEARQAGGGRRVVEDRAADETVSRPMTTVIPLV